MNIQNLKYKKEKQFNLFLFCYFQRKKITLQTPIRRHKRNQMRCKNKDEKTTSKKNIISLIKRKYFSVGKIYNILGKFI